MYMRPLLREMLELAPLPVRRSSSLAGRYREECTPLTRPALFPVP